MRNLRKTMGLDKKKPIKKTPSPEANQSSDASPVQKANQTTQALSQDSQTNHLTKAKPYAPKRRREKPPKAPKPEGAPPDRIHFICGHDDTNVLCRKCRMERAQKKREAYEARGEVRKANHGRLPHASTFHMIYDATTETWSGTLAVSAGAGIQTFDAKQAGVFHLLETLDQMYKALLEGKEPE